MNDIVERVARAMCKSRTCEGFLCCEHPANMARRIDCPVTRGGYNDAAKAAIAATIDEVERLHERLAAEQAIAKYRLETGRKIRAATIEECARVAEARWDGVGNKNGLAVAAAIRALKEEQT